MATATSEVRSECCDVVQSFSSFFTNHTNTADINI